jgi:hypothetical protein
MDLSVVGTGRRGLFLIMQHAAAEQTGMDSGPRSLDRSSEKGSKRRPRELRTLGQGRAGRPLAEKGSFTLCL